MKRGKVTIDSVLDGEFRIGPEICYPDIPADRWDKYEHLLTDKREIVNQLGGYLLRSDDYVALIDVGFGPTQGVGDWQTGEFLNSLDALGVKPEDVTDVLFTHLHFDHIGWASVEGDPVFANATYRCHEQDWAHFTGADYVDLPEMLGPGIDNFPADMTAQAKLGPIADRMKLWSGVETLLPGLDAVEFPGHTPGTSALRLTSDGETAWFIGDIAHHQGELVEPDIRFLVNMDQAAAAASQEQLLAELVPQGVPFVAAHFRDFEWGRVEQTDDGLAWQRIDEE